METAHEPSGRELGQDVAEAAMRLTRRRRIVHREHDAGERLHQEKEHRDATEDLMPTAGRGDVFVQKMVDAGFEAGAVLNPGASGFDHD